MSRIPTTPSRRPHTPSAADDDYYHSTSSTRPLQINRPPGANTPSNSSRIPPSPTTSSPARPQRSGLRSRQVSEYSNSDTASVDSRLRDSRDTNGSTRADIVVPPRHRNHLGPKSPSGYARSPTDLLSPTPTSPESELSPTSLAALAAFKTAAVRVKDDHSRDREREIAIQKDRQKKIRDRAPARQQTKHRLGDIDAVLDEIKDEWAVVTDPDFNPVDLALQLLDDSSLGKDMDSFRRTKDMLSRALKGSVDKHYQAFAGAITHHDGLMNHLSVAQEQITEARGSLQEAKEALGSKRADLVQLWTRSQTVEEMLRILDQIEHLRSVPDVLESLISEKRLLQASALLVRSLKMINKQDMLDIGALADLRIYLVSQETALREILVDELSSHLYLKSFWCDSRWAVYNPNQHTFSTVEFEAEVQSDLIKEADKTSGTPSSASTKRTRLHKYLDTLNMRPNEPPYDLDESNYRQSTTGMTSSTSLPLGISSTSPNPIPGLMAMDTHRNPEADSFTYIETLLESLALLGRLGNALDSVTQKLPQEIYGLVEATLDEVAERAEYGRRDSTRLDSIYIASALASGGMGMGSGIAGVILAPMMPGSPPASTALRLATLESSTKRVDQEIMRDLFWTLYSKLDAVSQGLRVVYEVSNRIGSRKNFKDSSGAKPGSLFPLEEVWMPVQAEVRTLLNDYITDEEQGIVTGRNPISSINEVLREGRYNRDKTKAVFRFADTDVKSTSKTLRPYEESLTQVLKDTVPGLVQGSSESAVQAALLTIGTDDRLLGSGQHHRLLVHPNAFHVTVLFQPTLCFMERIMDVLPDGVQASQASSAVLDDFVLKVYLPQLEEKVSMIFHQTVTSPDAFQPEPASKLLANQPVVKASVQLMALINSLCVMLRSTPFHRESYSRLILTVIVQFYQRCNDRAQDLFSLKNRQDPEAVPRMSFAAQLAQRPELTACLSELYLSVKEKTPPPKLQQLCQQECNLESNLLGEKKTGDVELVASTKDLSALASLYYSVTWFASELDALKSGPDTALSPVTPLKLDPISAMTPYTPYLSPPTSNEQLKLPLSSAMAMRFQALHRTYEQLAENILYTIRIDIRCRVMHHLDLALRFGNYCIEGEGLDPDSHIGDLNAELAQCDDFASSTLPEAERRFIFEGIAQLMETLLVSNAKLIRFANRSGMHKMMRNIFALQQSVKTIGYESEHASFDKAKQYYSLFGLSPQDMLEKIRDKQEYTFDEYKTMLDLQCGVDTTRSEAAAAQASDRNYNMYVIELHGMELENSGEDVTP
ncbi:Exocyst complex component Sec8 [Abortiporus biennis]